MLFSLFGSLAHVQVSCTHSIHGGELLRLVFGIVMPLPFLFPWNEVTLLVFALLVILCSLG